MIIFIGFSASYRRAALFKWKKKNGSKATYESLTNSFERAGYQLFAELVRNRNPTKEQFYETTNSSRSDEASTSLVQSQPLTYPHDQPPEFPCTPSNPELFMLTDELVAIENITGG